MKYFGKIETGVIAELWAYENDAPENAYRHGDGFVPIPPDPMPHVGWLFDGETATEIEPVITAAQRIAEITARLTEIDLASVRALRASVAGTATEDDAAQLAALEAEAAALRAERAGLAAS